MRVGFALLLAVGVGAASPAGAQEASFPDVPPSHWAYDAVEHLARLKVVEGYPDGAFRGRRALTRYEASLALSRSLSEVGRRLNALQPHEGPVGRQGPPGEAGAPGVRGARGPQGSVGPRGPRPAEFNDLLREQQRLREDLTRLQQQYAEFGKELPKTEVQEVWAQLERLDQRTRRAANPFRASCGAAPAEPRRRGGGRSPSRKR